MAHPLPIVFLHAFPLNATMWAEQEAAQVGHRTTFAPDLPGFGGQPTVSGGLEDFADAVIAGCEAQGLDRAVFVGLSMGGYVAMRIADRHPTRVAGLVLADTRAGADDQAGREKRSAQAARARSEGCGWLFDAMLPALLGETSRRDRPKVMEKVKAMIDGADPEGVARALEAMRERPDSFELISSLKIPVLAMVGEEDTLTPPAESERIALSVKNAMIVVIPRAGHLSNIENAPAFNDALSAFVGEIG